MPVNFGVICDAVIVHGKTIFPTRTFKTLCKTVLLLHSLKQDGKWGREKQRVRSKQSLN